MDFLPAWPIVVTPLIAFGLMLTVGALGGFLVHRWPWFPSITGFMLVGLVCGPGGIGIFSEVTLLDSRILVDIALALILYRLGLSLDIKRIARNPAILFVSFVESMATFLVVLLLMVWAGIALPLALLVAAISISSSPAVLLHVANEVGAKGPVTGAAKTMVAMNNIFSYLAFSAISPLLHYSGGADWTIMLLQPLYRLVGSLLLGVLMAQVLFMFSARTHEAPQYRLALVIGTIMIGIGLSYELKLSLLFVPLVIGVWVRSLEQQRIVSKLDFGPAFELFFIVLFVSAGATLHLDDVVSQGKLLFLFVVGRLLVKVLVVTSFAPKLHHSPRAGFAGSLLLIPMAGLAIGLVQASAHLFPQYATSITALVFGAVAVFETIGPLVATFAFNLAGEAGKLDREKDSIQDSDRM